MRMAIADTVKQDLTAAMKAGEKDRVGALRLVLSELQKAAKEGGDDEQAVLRRERKRRLESARAFTDAGRPELAVPEEAEAELIAAYLPAELSDEELRGIVLAAIEESGASSAKDMGQVMKAAMARVAGRADGKRVSALVQEALACGARSSSPTSPPRRSAATRTRSSRRSRATWRARSTCAATSSRSTASPRRSRPPPR
jgi:uncharacterized protein YqeY